MKKRTIALILSLVLVLGCAVVGTLAWLQDQTEPVTNTFSPSKIGIELTETDTDESTEGEQHDYNMVPGSSIFKDPVVTVKTGSEDCYLFVKIEESENFGAFMYYEIADGWTELQEEPGVYYRVVRDVDEDQKFSVLENNEVIVSKEVTKDMMDALNSSPYPTLTFIAYACQLENVEDAAAAWKNITTPATPAE